MFVFCVRSDVRVRCSCFRVRGCEEDALCAGIVRVSCSVYGFSCSVFLFYVRFVVPVSQLVFLSQDVNGMVVAST